ncbi:VOC family protein [Roseivirga sp. BDSF3-8]|uniref:VOC family protein n=1 Tax=Roseivirga sp. BDSF3-8 TaxID=3241598 RepID=UPI0035320608
MSIKQVKETCLYIEDIDRTKAFYEKKLGLPVISIAPGRHIFFRAGTSVLLCFIAAVTKQEERLPPHYAKGKQHIAFEISKEEYMSWKEKLREVGVRITHEEHWKNGYSSFYFDDPDGHVLEIVEEGFWG